jgi:uncharacterized protein YndB with AHSA1/START domain
VASEPLTVSVFVEASPDEVYEYFTRAESMVRWMGEYALLEARPDGEFTVDIEGTPVRGRYRELDPPNRVVFTWGFAGSEELPPGSSASRSSSCGMPAGRESRSSTAACPPP